MTEEKIAQLQKLLFKREETVRKKEAFKHLMAYKHECLYFNVYSDGWDEKQHLESIEDKNGILSEAIARIYSEYQVELEEIQSEIERL